MSSDGSDLASDLKTLADTLLTRLEPMLRQASEGRRTNTAHQSSQNNEWRGCSWCPVCACAALLRGEQHDLLTLLTVDGAALIGILKDYVAKHNTAGAHASGPDTGDDADRNRGNSAQTPERPESPVSTETDSVDTATLRPPSTHRPHFVPITVVTEQSPTEDRPRT